ncbi:mannose-1-phosphate guanylyltransferase/mannose-6-phosphate isomerase [Roseinatronobacter sp.]|uniref:mannose-1-phosphate guanylyltransferase/mannose-6-phosphate isomerase n=1 Tax=Roseinatronobacter sp. TaxID=1945755 RepID=UPI0025CEE05B|nr:mannose-1-phosphate guanylyltransferase/mannose-6-phosphate isomerase [Roseibaca sp.]
MTTITPVLLAGGAGTRLWPLSRKSYPKQFAKLMGEESLFQGSARRLSGAGFKAPIVVTGDPFRFIVTEQLAGLGMMPEAVLIEPSARNTAPAVAAAALYVSSRDPDGLLLIAPSDHVIPDQEGFRAALEAAAKRAAPSDIVTFGITPTRPETGYGYLELAKGGNPQAAAPQPLARFVEKPDAARAAEMIADGGYLWNAGIFLASAAELIAAYEAHAPETLALSRAALEAAKADLGFTRLDPAAWEELQDVSIDYAIMEKARNLVVMPYGGCWSDLGGWEAVWQASTPDADGTAVSPGSLAIDCRDTLLRSEAQGQRIVGIGLEDIVAIATPDAVLVTRKSQSQRAKEAVTALRAEGARQAESFPVDHRPWGHFESLARGARFQVKRIVVKPGAALSLQSHHHRAEHWIVVEGTARVTIGEEVRLVTENQSVYVPLGAVHRLENPGKVEVVLIEVQTGTYLGEDDILRYEDVYART